LVIDIFDIDKIGVEDYTEFINGQYEYNYIEEINQVYKLKYNNHTLNFIITDLIPIRHIETYDLTIVKNLFYRVNKINYLSINNINNISNKFLKVVNPTHKYIARLFKYIHRGYKIYSKNIEDDISHLNNMLYSEKMFRGRIHVILDNKNIEPNYTYPCLDEFDCLLKYFYRKYDHVHVVPGGINIHNEDKLCQNCSNIIINI